MKLSARMTASAALLLILAGTVGCTKLKARDQLVKGVQAFKAGKYEEAVDFFQKSVALDPTSSESHLYLATAYSYQVVPDLTTPENLAIAQKALNGFNDVLAQNPRLVAVGVEIGEPGNAGTLIRIADAMGAAAVVFIGHSVDPYNGKCLRASAGSIFAVPVVVAPDVDAAITALRGAGLRVVATTVDAKSSLDEADLAGPTAWLFGSEAHGLSAEIAEQADTRLSIPMSGSAQSLNVAAAAAICLYQSAKAQRA